MTEAPEEQRREGMEPLSRLNLEISTSLHIRIKVVCALKGRPMEDVIVEILEGKFPPPHE